MKRLVSAFLAGAMALSLAACGGIHFYGCFFCRRLCRPGKLRGR